MARIVILGNSAGGKSTLARRLSREARIEHVEIDKLYWREDWTPVQSDRYLHDHDAAISGDSWIIDGGGDMASIETRLARSTHVILIDLPLWLHFLGAAERQMAWANGGLSHAPGGMKQMPPTDRLFEIIWELDRDWMPKLRQMCDTQEAKGKSVFVLETRDAIDGFGLV